MRTFPRLLLAVAAFAALTTCVTADAQDEPSSTVTVRVEPDSRIVRQGAPVTFPLSLANAASDPAAVTFTLTDAPDDWSVDVPGRTVLGPAGADDARAIARLVVQPGVSESYSDAPGTVGVAWSARVGDRMEPVTGEVSVLVTVKGLEAPAAPLALALVVTCLGARVAGAATARVTRAYGNAGRVLH